MAAVALYFLLGMVGLTLVVGLLMWVRSESEDRVGPLRRRERRELEAWRTFGTQVRDLAIEYKALENSDLPYRLLDLIEQKQKELGK